MDGKTAGTGSSWPMAMPAYQRCAARFDSRHKCLIANRQEVQGCTPPSCQWSSCSPAHCAAADVAGRARPTRPTNSSTQPPPSIRPSIGTWRPKLFAALRGRIPTATKHAQGHVLSGRGLGAIGPLRRCVSRVHRSVGRLSRRPVLQARDVPRRRSGAAQRKDRRSPRPLVAVPRAVSRRQAEFDGADVSGRHRA